MDNETTMRKVFRVLNLENQADLLVHARQSYINQKEIKNEETPVCDGNISLHIDVYRRNCACTGSNGQH